VRFELHPHALEAAGFADHGHLNADLVVRVVRTVLYIPMNQLRIISVHFASLKDVKFHEYLLRFVFGGLCTVAAGLIAKQFGPEIGGLFLAFPAIFPAGASLLESHEKRKMAKAGLDGTNRGRQAASVDAAGASIGCIGLVIFAITLWKELVVHNAYLIVATATLAWLLVSIAIWYARKSRWFRRRAIRS
jgi:Protein of unknown function (DUF3147)